MKKTKKYETMNINLMVWRLVGLIEFLCLMDGGGFWGPVAKWGLPRGVSDHCHIVLKYDNQL